MSTMFHKVGQLEQPLIDLKAAAGLLFHMCTSDREAASEELGLLYGVLMECHEDILEVYEALREPDADEAEAQVAALKAEVAGLKASKGAPGSEDDLRGAKTCRQFLIRLARTVLAECEEAGWPVQEEAAEGGGV
jgi:hypothetical protein